MKKRERRLCWGAKTCGFKSMMRTHTSQRCKISEPTRPGLTGHSRTGDCFWRCTPPGDSIHGRMYQADVETLSTQPNRNRRGCWVVDGETMLRRWQG
eukprot:scaffold18565_cov71-Skeletonema_dohrnii-CCMP3373.AAC.2